MMTVVRKLENVSEVDVPVKVSKDSTVYIHPGGTMKNIDVLNLDEIGKYVKVEQDLSEVPKVSEGRVRLND